MKKLLFYLFLVFSFTVVAQNEALFERATVSYNDGLYDQAIEDYLRILENGQHSSALYYNLGNCYYKLNQIAPSIYYYEKALLMDPGDKEIQNNLTYAQQMTIDDIKPLPESGISRIYNSAIGWMTFDQWAYTAVIFSFLFVIAYIVYYFLRYSSHKRLAFIISMMSLITAMICVVFAFVQHNHYKSEQPAIVFAQESLVKSEPNERSSEVFLLHEGTKVMVLEDLEEYIKIEIADGKSGWVLQEDIKLLKDF